MTGTYQFGWDYFVMECGAPAMTCKVCDETMEVDRNAAGLKHPGDVFRCKNFAEKWHQQMLALFQEADRTPSKVLATQFRSEALAILVTRRATKTNWKLGI